MAIAKPDHTHVATNELRDLLDTVIDAIGLTLPEDVGQLIQDKPDKDRAELLALGVLLVRLGERITVHDPELRFKFELNMAQYVICRRLAKEGVDLRNLEPPTCSTH